jgi:hypothetical protein
VVELHLAVVEELVAVGTGVLGLPRLHELGSFALGPFQKFSPLSATAALAVITASRTLRIAAL